PLAQAGATQIVIANRTVARAQQLVRDIQPFVSSIALQAIGLDALAGEYDLVINATSASLNGEALTLPAELQFGQAYEMAYGKESSFSQQAKMRGAAYSDGFSMLVGQAIEAFYVWHGIRLNLRDFL
ncbi:MAG: shikimate dehydrogenase, partial [Sphingobacteriales bacterium]